MKAEISTREQISSALPAELVEAYVGAAAAHSAATTAGDDRPANDMAERVAALYAELRRRGSEAQRLLLVLLDHDKPGVRVWAASHALDFAPSAGEPVLRSLASEGSIVGFVAETTLEEWRSGLLRFPDPP